MTIEPTVSVIIPTVGRASLRIAVESALNQTVPPLEVIVVVDSDREPELPISEAIRVLRTSGGEGPGRARQLGIDSANGSIIALLDDDDSWRHAKLERQLAAAPDCRDSWIVSCRYERRADGRKPLTMPRRLIGPHERVAPYLMQLASMRRARPSIAVPTLMFPRAVADAVPLSVSAGSIHDDPSWLMRVQRELPDLPILQLPDCLVEVNVTANSESRPGVDRSADYIDWGKSELADESKRVRGDYFLYSPVSSALEAGSFRGVLRSIVASVRWGRPGIWAWVYVSTATTRIALRKVRSSLRRPSTEKDQ
ncbi:glycosyltransferase family 2 protein [Mycolicibacterium obuense]|uniref:glycosyltransferase family 2 protein n=1 Tax=Mycolicibacterium obuense TaxID=1807 RepID=UPI00140C8CA7|nr:glycosyltransferase family 2 protein [Mycolicibacterium obuense]